MGDWHQLPERVSQGDCEGGVVTVVSVAGQVCGDAQVWLIPPLQRCQLGVGWCGGVAGAARLDDERTKGWWGSQPACRPNIACRQALPASDPRWSGLGKEVRPAQTLRRGHDDTYVKQ